MKTVIMAGGPGSRLRSVTAHLLEALAPVGSPAFIECRRAPANGVVMAGSIDGAQARIPVEVSRDRMAARRKETA